MYKKKYLKYKSKYLDLKSQLGGGPKMSFLRGFTTPTAPATAIDPARAPAPPDIQHEYNTLRIKKEQFILIIDYNYGEINVIDPTNQQYTIWKNIPSSNDDNLWGNDWLFRSRYTDKPIYKELIETAIIELERDNSTIIPMKDQFIEQLKFYIKMLSSN